MDGIDRRVWCSAVQVGACLALRRHGFQVGRRRGDTVHPPRAPLGAGDDDGDSGDTLELPTVEMGTLEASDEEVQTALAVRDVGQ